MQTFINIKMDTDCRWRRVIDGQLKDKSPDIGSDINFFDIESSAMAYTRDTEGSHIFLCTKKMGKIKGSVRPKLLAILNDDEFHFTGRIIWQMCLPSWFSNLENDSDRRRTIINELPDFSKWFCDKNDSWISPEFRMSFLARIVDKLLTSIKKNEKAKVVIACERQNLDKAQELLYYVLRCLPIKLSNRLTFNTAAVAKEITMFDICCGSFTEADIADVGGIRFDIAKALMDEKSADNSDVFENAYAEYIRILENDEDPCKGFEDVEDVNALNLRVEEEVLLSKSNRIVEKSKTTDISVDDLVDLAEKSKGRFELVKKQLQKIAEFLCTNYTGFTSFYFQLAPEYKNFYLSFISDKGKCPKWGHDGNVDLLFANHDGETCNNEYIKCLYNLWFGKTRKTVYKNNNDFKSFLFFDYDERFRGNSSLYKAFVGYWDSMSEKDFIDFLCQGEVWYSQTVLDYLISSKGKSVDKFIAYCCKLKADDRINDEIVDSVYNKYCQGILKQERSVDELELLKTAAEKNNIILNQETSGEIKKRLEDEGTIRRSHVIKFLSSNNTIENIHKTKKKDRRIAEKRKKRRGAFYANIDDEIVVYNIARLSERDCGDCGTKDGANWSGRLKVIAVFIGIIFLSQMAALGLADLFLLNKLYIVGHFFWIEVGLTVAFLIFGILRWIFFIYTIYSKGDCGKDYFESRSCLLMKWLFALCVSVTIIKIALAMLCIMVF